MQVPRATGAPHPRYPTASACRSQKAGATPRPDAGRCAQPLPRPTASARGSRAARGCAATRGQSARRDSWGRRSIRGDERRRTPPSSARSKSSKGRTCDPRPRRDAYRHCRESGDAGAAQELDQDRLELVVAVMRRSGATRRREQWRERGITSLARRSLDARAARRREAELSGPRAARRRRGRQRRRHPPRRRMPPAGHGPRGWPGDSGALPAASAAIACRRTVESSPPESATQSLRAAPARIDGVERWLRAHPPEAHLRSRRKPRSHAAVAGARRGARRSAARPARRDGG